jgi:uncharacterized protein DUF4136
MRIKLAIVGAMLLTGLIMAAQEAVTHYASGYDIANAKTFAVEVMTKWNNPTNEEYAKKMVIQQLTERGYVQATDPSSADLLVEIHGATKDKTSVHKFYTGTSMDNYGFSGPAGVTPSWETEYKVGAGVVDIFDTKTKRLVFRGAAQDVISDQGQQNQKKIEDGVVKIFKDFPRSKG